MQSIVLRSDLLATLAEKAEQEATNINDLVNEAVERYLRERQRTKLDREIAAYKAIFSQLQERHYGEWVAFDGGTLVDSDSDRTELYRRIRAKYGRTSVLIRQVTDQPVEEVWVRTPSTGKAAS